MESSVSNKHGNESVTDSLRVEMYTASLKKTVGAAVILSGIHFGGALMTATTAHADFRICNDTKSLVGAALGYKDGETWISEGWFQVPPETCSSLIEGDLNSQFYYIYAEDADKGGQWRGDVFLCTNEREFKIEGVEDCFKRGHIKTGFFEIDTGNRANWMVRLTEQSQSQPQSQSQTQQQ